MIKDNPKIIEQNNQFSAYLTEKRKVCGIDNVITNDRVPKTGLLTIDKHSMQKWGIMEYSAESIIQELFFSQFIEMAFPRLDDLHQ